MMQKLQRSVSAKATPLMALAGMAPPNAQDAHATHKPLPLKSVLRQELQLASAQSGSQSIEPLLQAGGPLLHQHCTFMHHSPAREWCYAFRAGSLQRMPAEAIGGIIPQVCSGSSATLMSTTSAAQVALQTV